MAHYVLQKQVMTLHHFNALDQDKQRWWVLERGVYLSNRKTDDFTVFLFQLDGFYIEIFFHNENDEVYLIKSFANTDELEPYLEEINLFQLLNCSGYDAS